MKKIIFLLIFVALVIWVLSWFRSPEAVATSAAQQWPGGLGPIESVAARFPARKANEAAAKLAALRDQLPKSDVVEIYVGREVTRPDLTIGRPPSLPDVSPIRELLLREPVIWKRPGGIPEVGDADTQTERGVQMTVGRALIASALAKGHAKDPAAWEDLHAAWNLVRSLEGQPAMMTQTAALSILRMINAVAWKMPLPAPAWFAELQGRDPVVPLLEAFQVQAAAYWKDGTQLFPTKFLADSVEKDRRIAEGLFNAKVCDVTTATNDLGTDLSAVWRRAFRYRAEREATANALRVREGKPIAGASRCSDGGWTLDGTTLRFKHDIATGPPDKPMPLVLNVAEATAAQP